MANNFAAWVIDSDGQNVKAGIKEWQFDRLDAGEVVIGVRYSSINYKDALASTGKGKIVRRFPCIGGIDLAGDVINSTHPDFHPGDQVLATGYGLGVSHHGGYSQIASLPAGWLTHLPAGLSPWDAMAYGTAGFTAALAIDRMQHNGLTPSRGPVAVSGASGGVGHFAVAILAKLGYTVVAITGKADAEPMLKAIGAAEVILRQNLDLTTIKPLATERWAGAVDNLGGNMLALLLASMQVGGTVASIGLADSMNLQTSVAPFILRGVSLLGVDSVNADQAVRQRLWQSLATDWRPSTLTQYTETVDLSRLPSMFAAFLESRVKGRIVVNLLS